jgi:hypothetical protein
MTSCELTKILQNEDIDIISFYRNESLTHPEELNLAKHNMTLTWVDRELDVDGYCRYIFKTDNLIDQSQEYFALEAYYDSWSGSVIDEPWNFRKVKPTEKTIIVYDFE